MEEEKSGLEDGEPIVTNVFNEMIEELRKELKTLAANHEKLATKYNNDMLTLNRILSTYEDELSSVKSQYFDLSFKFKQLTQKPSSTST